MKNITPGKFQFSEIEKMHLLKSWIFISLAFAIAIRPTSNFISGLVLSGFTIGFAFLLHEIAHKYLAIRYRCHAEYRANDNMLLLMLFISLFGIIFAAPGAVMISGHVNKEKNGKIALAGPATNIILGILFLFFIIINIRIIPMNILKFGLLINGWLALFNMIPILGFDGHKVFNWNRTIFYITLGVSFLLIAASQNI